MKRFILALGSIASLVISLPAVAVPRASGFNEVAYVDQLRSGLMTKSYASRVSATDLLNDGYALCNSIDANGDLHEVWDMIATSVDPELQTVAIIYWTGVEQASRRYLCTQFRLGYD